MFGKLISKKKNTYGFTLIEVLVSIIILCIGIFAIMSMLSNSAKGNSEARKLTRAVNLASSKLDIFLYNGTCKNATQGIYTLKAQSDSVFPNGTNSTTIRSCKVTVSWESYGKNREIELTTLKQK